MTSFVLIYTFFFANGEFVIAEREAHTQNMRPVKTIEQCMDMAKVQEERLREGIQKHHVLFTDVTITCERKHFRGKKR